MRRCISYLCQSRVVDITWSVWHQKQVVQMSTHTTHQQLFTPTQLVGTGMGLRHSGWSFTDQACHCEVQEERSSEFVNTDKRSQRPSTTSQVSSLQVFKGEHVRRRVYRHLQHVTLE